MAKIKDLPALQRPREKALHFGIESLNDYELLALIIGSGSQQLSAIDIAYAMINENGGLLSLINKPFSDLLNYHGMGRNKALKLSAAFELAKRFPNLTNQPTKTFANSEQVYRHYLSILSSSNQENVYLIILDKKMNVIHESNLFRGTKNTVSVSNKQIIQQIVMHDGYYFYLVHNHPSGNSEPSEDDTFFTTELIRECQKFQIVMLDHIIISQNGYFSFLHDKKSDA